MMKNHFCDFLCDLAKPDVVDVNKADYAVINNEMILLMWVSCSILRKTIEGYLDSVPPLTYNTIKT